MISGKCSLIICGDQLDFEELSQHFKVKPSRMVRKEDSVHGSAEKSRYDFWIYEIKFDDIREPNDVLRDLLDRISSGREFVSSITADVEAHIKFFVQSEMAQLRFEFTPDTLALLSNMGLKLEVAVLSWGGVEDN